MHRKTNFAGLWLVLVVGLSGFVPTFTRAQDNPPTTKEVAVVKDGSEDAKAPPTEKPTLSRLGIFQTKPSKTAPKPEAETDEETQLDDEGNPIAAKTAKTPPPKEIDTDLLGYRAVYLGVNNTFPTAQAEAMAVKGQMLVINYELCLARGMSKTKISYPDFYGKETVGSGKYDKEVTAYFEACKKFGKPVLMAPLPEFDGEWTLYCAQLNGGFSEFAKVWNHLNRLRKAAGADNVFFICYANLANHAYKLDRLINEILQGVDYIGINLMNWGNTQIWSVWTEPEVLIKEALQRVSFCKKPVIAMKIACSSQGGNKSDWLKNLATAMNGVGKDIIAGIYYGDPGDPGAGGRRMDWPLNKAQELVFLETAKQLPIVEKVQIASASNSSPAEKSEGNR